MYFYYLYVTEGVDTTTIIDKMRQFVAKKKITPKNGLLKLVERVCTKTKRIIIPPLDVSIL